MTREQWKNKNYRKFRNRTAFLTRGIEQHLIDMSEIESISPIYLSVEHEDYITMFCNVAMKSGQKIKIEKDLKRLYRKVTYTNLFGLKRIKRVPISGQGHFNYYGRTHDSDGAVFQRKLNKLGKDFKNNVCIIRNAK